MKKILLIGLMLTLPILFMIGIFQFGKNIQAPLEIDGSWSMIIAEQNTNSGNCNLTPILGNSPKFSILQSGKFIHLSLNAESGPQLKGKLDRENLVLKNHKMVLATKIEKGINLISMQGQLKLVDCDEPIQFSAQMDSKNGGDSWTQ